MAVSAGAALVTTLSSGVTFSAAAGFGFSMGLNAFITKFLVSTAIGAAINALTPKQTTPAQGYTVTAQGSNLDHQIIYGQTRVAGAVVADFLSGEGGAIGTRFLHRVQVMAGHEVESYEAIYVNSYKVTEWKVLGAGAGDETVLNVTDISPYVDQPFNVLVPTKLAEVAPDGTETEATDIDYAQYNALAMQFWTGTDNQTASTKLIVDIPDNKWTSDHRLRGRAYMYIRMGRDADGDFFPTGVPEITAVIKGRKVYDPREVSHDPDDKSTWEWSDNPALCIRDYLTQDFGLGEKDIQVDDDLVIAAANVCDQTASDGSTRYTCNGAFTTAIQPYDLLNSILSSMGGMLWYAQGQWRMKPAYWTSPVQSFNEDNLRSTINVSTRHSRKDNFNVVEGTFRGPASNYALTTFPQVTNVSSTGTSVNAGSFVVDDVYIINTLGDTDWNAAAGTTGVTYAAGDSFKAATTGSGTGTAFSTFNSYLQTDGGIESKIDLELPFTDTPEEARRISRIVLERNRQQLTVRASFGLKALRVQVGDVINLSLARFGWENKTFEVTEWSFGNVDQYDIQIELTLREISENVFDEIDDGAAFELDNGSVPSPLAGLAVTNLTATPSGFLTNDGTFIGNILVEWDAIVNSNVREYIVEWGRAAFNFDDYGGEVTSLGGSPTARETFIFNGYNSILGRNPDQEGFDYYNTGGGSSLTQAQFEAQLANSPEARAISGSARVDGGTTEYTIASAVDDSMYSIRVKAINDFGTSSAWATVTVNTGKDDTSPNAPTSLTATGGIQSVSLSWTAPTQNTNGSTLTDFREHIVYGGTTTDPSTEIGRTTGTSFTHSGLLDSTTYYYRVAAADYSGNISADSNEANATTNAELTDGDTGDTIVSGRVYYQTLTGTQPSTPAATSYNTSTGLFSGLTSGWAVTQPPVEITDTTVQEWSSNFTVTIDGVTSAQTINFTTPTGAIQVTTDLQSDNYSAGSSGWSIERDTGNAEFNDATIRGTLDATNITVSGEFSANVIKLGAATGGTLLFDVDASNNLTLRNNSIDPSYIGSLSLSNTEEVTGVELASGLDRVYSFNHGMSTGQIIVFTRIINNIGVYAGLETGKPYHIVRVIASSSLFEVYDLLSNSYVWEGLWLTSTAYQVNDIVYKGDTVYRCTVAHTSGSVTEPGVGASWTSFWTTLNPVDITITDQTDKRTRYRVGLEGVHINTSYWPNQFRAYQDSSAEYAAYFENLSTTGGTVQVRSQGGFTAQFLTTTAGSGHATIDAQNTASGGGKAQICLSSSDGGYAYFAPQGDYLVSAGYSYLPFTGTHFGVMDKTISPEPGDIIIDSDVLVVMISDSICKSVLSNEPNQAGAVGVYTKQDVWHENTALSDDYSLYENSYHLIKFNGVGEGAINVCGEGGDISKGDLIVTSSIPGKGMKQGDDIVRSYTVAKAREDVTFSSPTDVKMVPCIYLCG